MKNLALRAVSVALFIVLVVCPPAIAMYIWGHCRGLETAVWEYYDVGQGDIDELY